jgi:hypothetical protein
MTAGLIINRVQNWFENLRSWFQICDVVAFWGEGVLGVQAGEVRYKDMRKAHTWRQGWAIGKWERSVETQHVV